MSDAALLEAVAGERYPERAAEAPQDWVNAFAGRQWGRAARAVRARRARNGGVVALVRACEPALAGLDLAALSVAARDVGRLLRRDGFRIDLVAQAFAIVSAVSERTLGKRHFDVQLRGGWVLLKGMVAEMETGEGKTLTATLPACTAALAGIPVHVITVNDYLVSRDAELTRPIYAALGLTLGVATEKQTPPERQAAYACHITYGSNKVIVFDYLRDRITLDSRNSALRLQLERLGGGATRSSRLLLRGLAFAIIDEADSVLVDEARTPLIISAPAALDGQELLARQGIALAKALTEGADFTHHRAQRSIVLTSAGKANVAQLARPLGGIWQGLLRREEMAVQALSALHLFALDEDYLIRDGAIEIIDENTGRTMADRSWERGLHQLIEAKEDCTVTAPKEPLSRISYQRFFRRYLLLSGMTGTGSEVAGEMGDVYGLPVVKIPTNRTSQRKLEPDQVVATGAAKWDAIIARVAAVHARGQPVLLGTRSVAASELASRLMDQAGLAHVVLNAKQDGEEAAIVAKAGQAGSITIATNMAGRGTDIHLGEGVAALGGLHVILSERYDSKRIDRQLAGRCARQGDPGSVEPILSLDDALLASRGPLARGVLARLLRSPGPLPGPALAALAIRLAQKSIERSHARSRKALLKSDQQTSSTLAFSGNPE
jgi:preprotein translocase subunit SecA